MDIQELKDQKERLKKTREEEQAALSDLYVEVAAAEAKAGEVRKKATAKSERIAAIDQALLRLQIAEEVMIAPAGEGE